MIIGPTGSGKTGLSLDVTRELNKVGLSAEIISADSRAIYKGMDIGTAKPSLEERGEVPHFGLDLVYPDEYFTVADWKEYAQQKIDEIKKRGNVPIVVGGTGLYIDALVFDYGFNNIVQKSCSDRKEMCSGYKIFGIEWDRQLLRKRLVQRVNKIFVQELFNETKELAEKYDWEIQAMKSNIYKYVWMYLKGELTEKEAKERAVTVDYQLTRRQMTWFRRNPEIRWGSLAETKKSVLKCIQDE